MNELGQKVGLAAYLVSLSHAIYYFSCLIVSGDYFMNAAVRRAVLSHVVHAGYRQRRVTDGLRHHRHL
jgi:hypothetical protein